MEDIRSQVGKPGAYSFEKVDDFIAISAREIIEESYNRAFVNYEDLLKLGVAKEVARTVIPVGAFTEFYWTVNARSLMNFISLRNDDNAQYEIRMLAKEVESIFADLMPVTYEAFVLNNRVAP